MAIGDEVEQDPFYGLGLTISSVWAKSLDNGAEWMPLIRHLGDTAAVMEALWHSWVPRAVRRLIAEGLGLDGTDEDVEVLAGRFAVFLAGVHDIGKCSPAFVEQVPVLAERMVRAGFPWVGLGAERSQVRHAVVSFTELRDWLRGQGISTRAALTLACAVGGHHGVYPTNREIQLGRPGGLHAGNEPIWAESRRSLIDTAATFAGLEGFDWSRIAAPVSQPAQLTLTGLIVVADWLASNVAYFPFDGNATSRARARSALEDLGLPRPWHPDPPEQDPSLFRSRFSLPSGGRPRRIQRAAMDLARRTRRPELVLVEAPTGEGKTEAALAAAEILAARFGCGGVMVALPTQATSDGMFPRVLDWTGRVIPSGESASAVLSHGKAQFNKDYQALRKIRPAAIYDDTGGWGGAVRAHWWLAGRKTAALADFVVGTIDQYLLAGLVSRHVCLRHLGLSGKVIVLDEVHAADAYMAVYLDRVLEWCGAAGVPAIALSATLPPARRAAMLTAYARGRGDTDARIAEMGREARDARGYPLLTTSGTDGPVPVAPSGHTTRIQVDFLDDDPEALADQVVDEVAAGGCVAIVCNTVSRAQGLFGRLEPRLGSDVVLLHSRFLAGDRLRIERDLREALGPQAGDSRPRRLVVVATQVIEQSLDIDFDLMISDLAPVDLVVQRAGRLHRHGRPLDQRPSTMHEARLVLTGLTRIVGGPPAFPRGCERVYGRAALLRSALVLERHLARDGTVVNPTDVAELVRLAYDDDLVPEASWQSTWDDAERRRIEDEARKAKDASVFCIRPPTVGPVIGFTDASVPDDDLHAQAAVRDSEDALEVIVIIRKEDGQLRTVPWLDAFPDTPVDMGTEVPDSLARAIARCTVRLPSYLTAGGRDLRVIDALERDGIDTWQTSQWLRGELPLVLDANYTREIDGFLMRYDRHRGLIVDKADNSDRGKTGE